MKICSKFILLVSFALLSASTLVAQSSTSPAETAANLRAQLGDVIQKETDLQSRLEDLDEALKPENIDNYSQNGGSTRPEEVRDQRRRELTNERTGVVAQLDLARTSRARLESAIQTADSLAYQQAALGPDQSQVDAIGGNQIQGVPRWQKGLLIGLVAAMGLVAFVALIRRRNQFMQK
jgi:hypothetical protein